MTVVTVGEVIVPTFLFIFFLVVSIVRSIFLPLDGRLFERLSSYFYHIAFDFISFLSVELACFRFGGSILFGIVFL